MRHVSVIWAVLTCISVTCVMSILLKDTLENELIVFEGIQRRLQIKRLTGRCQEENNRIHNQSSVSCFFLQVLLAKLFKTCFIPLIWLVFTNSEKNHRNSSCGLVLL